MHVYASHLSCARLSIQGHKNVYAIFLHIFIFSHDKKEIFSYAIENEIKELHWEFFYSFFLTPTFINFPLADGKLRIDTMHSRSFNPFRKKSIYKKYFSSSSFSLHFFFVMCSLKWNAKKRKNYLSWRKNAREIC